MAQIPAQVRDFMKANGVEQDEIWLLPGGRSYAIKHSALERIAATRSITFDAPQIIEADGANGVATVLVTAHMGDASTWTFGEASPKNNKNAYCFAMAEKRAKDRCILKLLNTHGTIYSEDEADEFKQRQEAPAPSVNDAMFSDAESATVRDSIIMALEKCDTHAEIFAWRGQNKAAFGRLTRADKLVVSKAKEIREGEIDAPQKDAAE